MNKAFTFTYKEAAKILMQHIIREGILPEGVNKNITYDAQFNSDGEVTIKIMSIDNPKESDIIDK